MDEAIGCPCGQTNIANCTTECRRAARRDEKRQAKASVLALLSNSRFPTSRQFGKTTAAIALVKKCSGVLVCMNSEHARQVQREHNIRTVSILDHETLGKLTDRLVIDQDAALVLLSAFLK